MKNERAEAHKDTSENEALPLNPKLGNNERELSMETTKGSNQAPGGILGDSGCKIEPDMGEKKFFKHFGID